MRRGIVGILLLFPLTGFAAPTEILTEGSITVVYEQTGDQEQIAAFKKEVLPAVKEILSSLSSDLTGSSDFSQKATVNFYSPETYHQKFPDTVDKQIPAFFDGKVVQARADNDVNFALKTTLRHELTHLLLGRAYANMPSWVNEGLAMYEERKISVDPVPNNVDYNTLHIAGQDGKYIPISKLEVQGIFDRSHGTVTSGLAYTQAYVAVYELIQKSGMDAVRQFLSLTAKKKPATEAFESAFGMSYEKFDAYLLDLSGKKT